MDIFEVRDRVRERLKQEGRLSYRILKMQFALDDDQLKVLKEELIEFQALASDKDGKMLVWTGDGASAYTPPHLAERIRAEHQARESHGATDGERKTITALFADLKGSTALIEGLDPEDTRAIIDPALQLMMDAVHRYDGYVVQALGDGIFALFGAPIAHEDHPQRALYAALRMRDEMRGFSDQPSWAMTRVSCCSTESGGAAIRSSKSPSRVDESQCGLGSRVYLLPDRCQTAGFGLGCSLR